MKRFINENFMLKSDAAEKLYHEYAENMPIFDYHCHLSPREMYEDKPFDNIARIFLGGDHYKWRYMRSNGVDEEYITGSKSDYEKFKAFCGCLRYAVGNPLYHWTHLELKRYFGVDETVTADNCGDIWEKCNAVIKDTQMSPAKIINGSNVACICTTDDPADSLEYHKKIREKDHIKAKVLPSFRPDAVINIDKAAFASYIERLGKVCGFEIKSYDDLIKAVCLRADFFHSVGCRISDHALSDVPYNRNHDAARVFLKALNGERISADEAEAYKCATLLKLSDANAALSIFITASGRNDGKTLAFM